MIRNEFPELSQTEQDRLDARRWRWAKTRITSTDGSFTPSFTPKYHPDKLPPPKIKFRNWVLTCYKFDHNTFEEYVDDEMEALKKLDTLTMEGID